MKTNLENTQFYADLSKALLLNNSNTSKGYYNLLVTIRDCKLYSIGLKPNRNWKISDVKKYFGIKGNAQQLTTQLEEIKNLINPTKINLY
jgi:hypothetical protein